MLRYERWTATRQNAPPVSSTAALWLVACSLRKHGAWRSHGLRVSSLKRVRWGLELVVAVSSEIRVACDFLFRFFVP